MTIPRLIKNLICTTAVIFGVCVVFSMILPLSPIHCEHQDIDLNTGRARITQMRFFIPVSVRYEHTSISEAIGIADLLSPTGDWKRVNTFSPGNRISPHYSYHGSLSQAHNLGSIWEDSEFTDDAREEAARTVLRLWRESGRHSGAEEFLNRLGEWRRDPITRKDVRSIAETANSPTESPR